MNATDGRRATDWGDFRSRMDRMFDPQAIAVGLAFRPRPTDVLISPFGKCGTTWLQQIVHGLRTRGDMDFDDISRVVPWIEMSPLLGLDLDAEQKADPRAFKSHLSWHLIPKGGRYIVSFRDPKDALVSWFRFMEGWFIDPGTITIEELARKRFQDRSDGRDYWTHLLSWWEQRENPDVRLLTFEGMKATPSATVRSIAGFLQIPLDDELLDLAVRQSSLAFMSAHVDRFDDRLMRKLGERRAGLPEGGDSAKVRKGAVGEHRAVLPREIGEELDAIWAEAVAPATGFASYDALRADVEARFAGSETRSDW